MTLVGKRCLQQLRRERIQLRRIDLAKSLHPCWRPSQQTLCERHLTGRSGDAEAGHTTQV